MAHIHGRDSSNQTLPSISENDEEEDSSQCDDSRGSSEASTPQFASPPSMVRARRSSGPVPSPLAVRRRSGGGIPVVVTYQQERLGKRTEGESNLSKVAPRRANSCDDSKSRVRISLISLLLL